MSNILIEKVNEVSAGDGRYVYLAGTALVPGTSLNHVRYLPEEIRKAAPSLENQKLNQNHDISLPPVGKVIASHVTEDDHLNFVVEMDANVNPGVSTALESGYIDHVSIEANPESVECSICGSSWGECNHYRGQKYEIHGESQTCELIPHNFTFEGLAVVFHTAGVPKATFMQSIDQVPTFIEKYEKLKENKTMSNEINKDNKYDNPEYDVFHNKTHLITTEVFPNKPLHC